MYTLYLSYDVNISALFLTGFLSGAFFAPFLGSAVDKFGRKNSCIAYCVLEIVINTLEHSRSFKVLLLGRVLGGVSTNLLFSAFESWMTTEHRKQGFPEEWLTRTYSEVRKCTFFCSISGTFPVPLTLTLTLPSPSIQGLNWKRGHGYTCRHYLSSARR